MDRQGSDESAGGETGWLARVGGEMARRVRELDWARTPLGATESWPDSLRVAVGVCLNSRFPMFVWWGPELINIYNDAYVPMLGKRHPAALGQPARASWDDIWDVVGPQAEAVMWRGEATWNERVRLDTERHGFREETYFTWSYSPIPDGAGGIGGLFCAVTEDTGRVMAERERDRLAAEVLAGEERYRSFVRLSSEGIWRFELEEPIPADLPVDEQVARMFRHGYLAECNDAMARMYGFGSAKEIEGRRLGEFHDPKDERSLEFLRAFVRAGYRLDDVETLEPDREGNPRIFVNSLVGLVEGGRLVRAWGTQRDVTEQRRAEERASDILESITDGFFAVDGAWRFTYVNAQAGRILERGRGELLGKVLWEEYPGLAGSEFEREYRRAADERVATSVTAYYPDHGRWYEVHSYPAPDGISVYFRDATEAKRAEEAVRASAQQMRLLTDSLPALIGYIDADQRYRFNNAAYVEWFGIPRDQLAGKHLREVLGEEDYRQRLPYVERVMRGEVVRFEGQSPHRERGEIDCELLYVPDVADGGRVAGFFVLVQDITARKREREELRAAKEEAERSAGRWRAVVGSMAEGVVVADAAGNLPEWNAAALEMHGYASLDEVRRHLNDFPEVLELTGADGRVIPLADWPMSRVLRGESFSGYEVTVRRLDVELRRTISYSGSPVRDRDGRVALAVLTLHDVTAQRRAQAAVRASEARFRELADAMPQIVWTARPDGVVDYYNRQWYEYTGMPEGGTGDPSWVPVLHPDDLEPTRERWATAVRTGELYETEYRYRRSDGQYRWQLGRAQPVWDAGGRIVRWFGTSTDIHDHKVAETSLRRSRERYRDLFDSIDQGFCVVEVIFDAGGRPIDYRFLEANRAFERQTGLVNAVGRTARELVPGLEQRWFDVYGGVAATGEPARFEDSSDPMGRWFDVYAFRAGAAAERRVAILFKDVTAAKRIEAALRESERRFRDMADTAPATLWVTEPDGRCSFLSRGWYELTGQTEETALGYGWSEAAHPDDRGRAREAFVAANAGRRPYELDFRLRRADGEYVWVIDAGRPRFGPGGEFLGMIGSVIDITDRKRAEAALREGEERLRAVFEQTEAGIAQVDLGGRFVLVNERYAQIVGRTREELLGLRMQDITHPDDLSDNLALLEKAVRDGTPFVIEKRYVRADGTEVWVSNSVSLMRGEGGKPSGVVAATVDITDRRRAEEALRESEQHARRIIDNTLAFVGVMTPDGTLTEANATALRAGGLRREDVVGRKFWDCYWWAYDAGVQARLRDAVARAAAGEVVRYDAVVRMAGDARMPIDFMLSPVKDGRGRVTHLIPSGVDIAERTRAEEQLRRSHDTFYHLIQNDPFGVYVVDADFRLREASLGSQKVFASVPRPLIGRDFGEVLRAVWAEPFASQAIAVFRRTLETGEPYASPSTIERRAGEERVEAYDWRIERITLPDGRPGVVCYFYDLSERQRWEAALREGEQRLQLALSIAEMGTFEIDLETDAVTVNEAGRAIYGWAGDEPLTFSKVQTHFHPEDKDEVLRRVGEALRPGGPGEFEVEQRIVRTDGATRWIRVRGRAVFAAGAAAAGGQARAVRCVGTYLDITGQREEAERRERVLKAERAARDEAERASRMKDEFLATLSHELRTPLNAILGWAQILRRDGGLGEPDPADVRDGLAVIERNARAQTQIIEDLLDMSRIISGKVRLDVRRLDVAEVVRSAVETVRPAADAKGVRVQAVLDPVAGPVSGDPGRLQQVFWNLLNNAVKFTPRGGRVQVVLERVNSHLEVSVADNGEGIAPEFLPHVFDRFRQADASTTRRHGGLGLGLAIVKQLVELHGGSVRAKSPGRGQGATFVVDLPLLPVDADGPGAGGRRHPTAEDAGSGAGAGSGGGGTLAMPDAGVKIAGVRVLVVDDEPDARAVVERVLRDCEAVVATAASAAEALERLAGERFDVLVSDIGMPEEDGYSLIRRVRALGAGQGGAIPAVALTAYARAEDRMRAVLAGFQMHVAKPVEPAELITMVASLAGRVG